MFNDDSKMAEKRFEEILVTLKNNDRDSLKTMFSKATLGDSKQIDSDIDDLFVFVNGNIISWKREKGLIVSLSKNNGDKVRQN